MSVPNIFQNETPPTSPFDLDADKLNENFDSLSDGSGLNDSSLKSRHIDDDSFLVTYPIKKFVLSSDLTQDPSVVGLSIGDIAAVNDTSASNGKIYLIKEDLEDIFSLTNQSLVGWSRSYTNVISADFYLNLNNLNITGKSTANTSAIHKSVTIDTDIYKILKVTIESVSNKWFINLKGAEIPGGELRVLDGTTTGDFEIDLSTLSVTGEITFDIVVGVENLSGSTYNYTVALSNLVFDNENGLWSLLKDVKINQKVVDESDSGKTQYRLQYNDSLEVTWFVDPIMDDNQITDKNTWSALKIKTYVDSLLP